MPVGTPAARAGRCSTSGSCSRVNPLVGLVGKWGREGPGLPEAFSRAVPGLAVSRGSCSLAAILLQTGALGTLGGRSWVELWLVVCTLGLGTSLAPTSSSSDTTQRRPHSHLPTRLVWCGPVCGVA